MSESADLQRVSQEFQKLQSEYSTTVEARQKLEAQLSENEFVKKVDGLSILNHHSAEISDPQEFDRLTPKSLVFKQIGPVLVKQDQSDAKQNVETRLDFIRSEM